MFDAKLRPPPPRVGIVRRHALVERMLAHEAEPFISVVAPPGYGKSTVLAQWSAQQGCDVAWMSVDHTDNDPSVLLAAATMALSRVQPFDVRTTEALTLRTGPISSALPRLTAALSASERAVALVLDGIEEVENPESLDVITELAWHLPAGSRLAVASRTQPPWPTPLLRAQRSVVEVGVDDLAMDQEEARQLLAGCGVTLRAGELQALLEQTEGWPVGLYLAGLVSKRGRQPLAPGFAFRGDDAVMADYLRSEVLSRLAPSVVSFLTRTAVLDELSGPLCDAVLEDDKSQDMLESLEASNLLLVPLDRHRRWYRYHRLFRELLINELQRNEADLVPRLHSRAAHWLEANRRPETAIAHAQHARDTEQLERLLALTAQPAYAAGRVSQARQWFDWFETEGLIETHPVVAVLGAWMEALCGHPARAERWAAAAELGASEGTLSDGTPVQCWMAYLRAMLCRHGPAQMRIDARLAQECLAPGSALRSGMLFFEGMSHLLEGDLEGAAPLFGRAYDLGVYLGGSSAASTAAAGRALIAMRRHDWEEGRIWVDRALAIVEDGHLEDYLGSGLVYAAAAQAAIHDGDLTAARGFLGRAAHVRPLLTYAVPCCAQIHLELARAYVELSDPMGARTVLREMREILQQRPDLGRLAQHADELQGAVDAMREGPLGASSLTNAELRVLPYLATHLSFKEIGERLYLSRHTVKTHAMSVYRKLGVSSRSEAMRRAHEMRLLGE